MTGVTPSAALRAAVTLDGRPIHQIAMDARVPRTVLSRFMRGDRGLTARSLDRIAGAVRMELRPVATAS